MSAHVRRVPVPFPPGTKSMWGLAEVSWTFFQYSAISDTPILRERSDANSKSTPNLWPILPLLGHIWYSLCLGISFHNNRICSFNWIRGSKHCFLTSFSNLHCYFLFLTLVFLQNCNLLVSLHLSWLRGTPISHPVFIPFVLPIPRRTCAPIFLAHMTCFLKARCSWKPGSRIRTGFLSPFRLSPKVSHANLR